MKTIIVLLGFCALAAIGLAQDPAGESSNVAEMKHDSALTAKSRVKRFLFPVPGWLSSHSHSSSSESDSRSSSRERARKRLRPYLDPMGYVFKRHHHHRRGSDSRENRRIRKYLIRKDQLVNALAGQQSARSNMDINPALIKLDSRK